MYVHMCTTLKYLESHTQWAGNWDSTGFILSILHLLFKSMHGFYNESKTVCKNKKDNQATVHED